MKCPKCSSAMVERKRKSDGNPFWGCSRFPSCRATRPGANESIAKKRNPNVRSWKSKTRMNPQLRKCPEKLPAYLSPTKAIDFMQCPRKFYENSISKRITFQGTEATVKGNLVHYALEKIFDMPDYDRNQENAISYISPRWEELKELPENKSVSALNDRELKTLLAEAEEIVKKWFLLENPKRINPLSCEMIVEAKIGNAPMRGVIDRVDKGKKYLNTLNKKTHVKILDYKTGKVPKREYEHESLFQISTYALAIEASSNGNIVVDEVELLYVNHRKSLRTKITDSIRSDTSGKFNQIWTEIETACSTGLFPAIPQPLCDWCDAKPICPVWKS